MNVPKKFVMASSNVGKLREIAYLLDGLGVTVVAQAELGVAAIEETGASFAENSLLKALHASAATDLPAIADDSGLVVDALDGAPGIYSARYSGSDADDDSNIAKLLDELKSVSGESRTAAFHCVATFVAPQDTKPLLAEGIWHGSILNKRRGEGGFGYDPIFQDVESGRSAAELSPAQKNVCSHRGQALRKLVALIEQRYS